MTHDMSYTPLEAEFQDFITTVYSGCAFSKEQVGMIRDIFFASASCVFGILQNKPDLEGILLEEVVDYAAHRAGAQSAEVDRSNG